MSDFIGRQVLSLFLPVILGPIVYYVMTFVKRGDSWLGKQSPTTQRAVALALSALIVGASKLIPGSFPCADTAAGCSIQDITPEAVKAALGAGVAFLIHYKSKQAPA